jgi:hypothetical protein
VFLSFEVQFMGTSYLKKRMYVKVPFIGRITQSMKPRCAQFSSQLRPDLNIRLFTKGVGVTYLEPVELFSAGPERPVEFLN